MARDEAGDQKKEIDHQKGERKTILLDRQFWSVFVMYRPAVVPNAVMSCVAICVVTRSDQFFQNNKKIGGSQSLTSQSLSHLQCFL
jgi:hypothetical protein